MNIIEERRDKKNKVYIRFRMIYGISMGLLYVCFGVFAILARKLGFTFNIEASFGFFMALGGLLILYGGFRIYRAFKHIF